MTPPPKCDTWYYPPDIAHDLDGIDLPQRVKGEIFATAWEYSRTVIPHYTNWNRYVAFMRIIVMGIIAEFKGDLLDVTKGDKVLNYSLDGVLADLFAGTPAHEEMAREYKTFLLVSGDKSSDRHRGEFFRRYANALAHSPEHFFRMRDTDALCRFTIAAALACRDEDKLWFSEEEFDLLAELGDVMYDSVAFYKHRSEGETNSTFAYMPSDLRVEAYRQCREVLWALDAAWARRPEMACVTSFIRYFGGPLQLCMRRYRFVEESMTIGRQEDVNVVEQTRNHYKLWNRIDRGAGSQDEAAMWRYESILADREKLLFPGLAEYIIAAGEGHCKRCNFRPSYGADTVHRFGGVELCDGCQSRWREHHASLRERAAKIFPELLPVYRDAILDVDVVEKSTAGVDTPPLTPEAKEEEEALLGVSPMPMTSVTIA